MAMISLAYETRDKVAKPAALRRAGRIPAVFYGKRRAATSISVPAKEFTKAFASAGENEVVTLAGPGEEVPALVHDVSFHPVSGAIEHVDFYAFEAGQKVAVKVPLEFIGIAPAVKEKGAVLVKVLRELTIEAEPLKLPHTITVDISPLVDFHSQILAKDVALPPGVTLQEQAEEVVASVYEPKEEKVEAAPPPDLSQIEVEKKGKEIKEGEETVSSKTPDVETPKTSGVQTGKKEEKKGKK